MEKQALAGIKVIDLSQLVSGPYCTKLLADLGAEVIKIEPPGLGDPSRLEGPFPGNKPDLNASGLFGYLNNNKKGITLNLKTSGGIAVIKRLIEDADILVENFEPGVMAELGIDYTTLKELNPRLIMTSITNFGQAGKYRDYKATELVAQAMSGWVSSIGEYGKPPLRAGGPIRLLDYITGTFAAMATMTAVIGRRKSQKGEHIDVSTVEVGLLQRAYPTVQDSFPNSTHKTPKRFVMSPSIEKCKDGYIGITLLTGQHWQDFCCMTEMYDWMEDPRFILLTNRLKHKSEFQARLDEWLMQHTREEIIEIAKDWKVPVIPVPTFEDMLSFPQYVERGLFVKVNHPKMGEVTQPGAPFHMSETPWRIKSPAPLLGEHTQDILDGQLGMEETDLQKMQTAGII
ncbi:CoA transferase [Sporosarcina sp. 179-K 3D1 HS]|uniref:CaiB/BaiF CoA transferase family protein n=1 Tax=Sporosarcina sp. 179-K 3D1 HS TaxID=3232169 RepID=UPI0039A37F67